MIVFAVLLLFSLVPVLSSAGEAFGKTSSDFSKVKVPDVFPQETKEKMKEINQFLAMGFKAKPRCLKRIP
ncbi:hypothetical protein NLX71_19760 [Paenibacillus sp. MZ04-78.2]|nr:hypothetical protein [Paenibacillus sp. MZ04-78.2]